MRIFIKNNIRTSNFETRFGIHLEECASTLTKGVPGIVLENLRVQPRP